MAKYDNENPNPYFEVWRNYFWREDNAYNSEHYYVAHEFKTWRISLADLKGVQSFEDLNRRSDIKEIRHEEEI